MPYRQAAGAASLDPLPIGIAHGAALKRSVGAGDVVGWDDVEIDPGGMAVKADGASRVELADNPASAWPSIIACGSAWRPTGPPGVGAVL